MWSSPYQPISVHIEFSARTGGNQGVATGKRPNDFNAVSGRACPGDPDHVHGRASLSGVAGTSPAKSSPKGCGML